MDLPESDVRKKETLQNNLSGEEKTIIHLAWNTVTENWRSNKANPDNLLMTNNVYEYALDKKIRVIMASSIHADMYCDWNKKEKMSPYQLPYPDSPYGASKTYMEALGRFYSTKGLEVICIRFGGVNPENQPPTINDVKEKLVWLNHRDCSELIRRCIEVKSIPNNFLIIYGTPNNEICDNSNPIGWKPLEKLSRF